MKKLVMFGAGNIGRSFIGQLFSRAGYETVFVDVREPLILALNENGRYKVEIRDEYPETIWVENVRGVVATQESEVAEEVASSDIVATAVGPNNLSALIKVVAEGLLLRSKRYPQRVLDIILCENLRNAADIFKEELKNYLPKNVDESILPGLVETSIGKMVPLVTQADETKDILTVYAEAYNTLILDAKGFRGPIPSVPGLDPKKNMKAYVDRKLFIHNLGHSITAYLGYLINKNHTYIWEAIGNQELKEIVRSAMHESADALIAEYPDEFNEHNQTEHIEDLIRRFSNRHLGDTIYRVGRDIMRKLSPDERLVGALRLEQKHKKSHSYTVMGITAALLFRATDEFGTLYARDKEFVSFYYLNGIQSALSAVSGFQPESDKSIIEKIEVLHEKLHQFSSAPSGSLQPILDIV